MARVEIDESELAQFQQGMALLRRLGTDTKSKPLFEKAVKQINPDVITEEDVAERYAGPVRAQVDALQSKIDDLINGQKAEREAAAQRAAEESLSSSLNRLRDRGYTDEGLGKIKELMVARSIADPEAAAALFDRQNPPAAVADSAFEPAMWNIQRDAVGADTEALFKDEDRWADLEAAKVINEFRQGN